MSCHDPCMNFMEHGGMKQKLEEGILLIHVQKPKMGLGRGDLYIDSENLERRLLYLSFANLNRFFSNKNENFLYVVGFRLCW